MSENPRHNRPKVTNSHTRADNLGRVLDVRKLAPYNSNMENNTLYVRVEDPDGKASWRRVRSRRPSGRTSYVDRSK